MGSGGGCGGEGLGGMTGLAQGGACTFCLGASERQAGNLDDDDDAAAAAATKQPAASSQQATALEGSSRTSITWLPYLTEPVSQVPTPRWLLPAISAGASTGTLGQCWWVVVVVVVGRVSKKRNAIGGPGREVKKNI